MINVLIFLIPFAAVIGWYIGMHRVNAKKNNQNMVPKDYLLGLNFLLNEQPDKAVDIFIKMLEVDSDTVETHLALGSLFRRRGEVDRAIRIHQNLIARPRLNKQQRQQALLALGQDYMRAGMLDRAERIFLDIVEDSQDNIASLYYLLDIYQQEKAWAQAAQIAANIATTSGESMQTHIAHYYCELALQAKQRKDFLEAKKQCKKALSADKNSVRASLIQGDIEFLENNFQSAIKYYKQVREQDADFLTESIHPICECYEKLNLVDQLIIYLNECLSTHARVSIAILLSDYVLQTEGIEAAVDLITKYMEKHPSTRGLKRLIELQLLHESTRNKENLFLLQSIMTSMLRNKPIYRCQHCGFSAKMLHWLCPGCKHWNTVKPIHGLEGD